MRYHQIMGLDRSGCIQYRSVLSKTHPDSNPIHAEVLIIIGASFRPHGHHRPLQEVPIEQPS